MALNGLEYICVSMDMDFCLFFDIFELSESHVFDMTQGRVKCQ